MLANVLPAKEGRDHAMRLERREHGSPCSHADTVLVSVTEMTARILDAFVDVGDDALDDAIAQHDPIALVEDLGARYAARMDAKAMGNAGIVVQYTCHTVDDSISRFIVW